MNILVQENACMMREHALVKRIQFISNFLGGTEE